MRSKRGFSTPSSDRGARIASWALLFLALVQVAAALTWYVERKKPVSAAVPEGKVERLTARVSELEQQLEDAKRQPKDTVARNSMPNLTAHPPVSSSSSRPPAAPATLS